MIPPYAADEDLPPADRERAKGILRPVAAERWRSARWALRRVLSGYLGEEPASIEIVLGEHGKPRLATGSLEFNLSHSGEVALIAVSRRGAVGVDVEKIEPARDAIALAEKALDSEDVATIRAADPDARTNVFYGLWVRHEARLKCLGVGLSGPAPSVPVTVQDLDVAPGYAAAVAVA